MGGKNVLILGGCGFIGRNLVAYFVSKNIVNYLRIVDKVPPQVAWLNNEHLKYFDNEGVEFRSANLINPDSCKNAFHPPEGESWDIVVNCAGETKYGQTDPVYSEGILKLSLNCAREAAKHNTKHYIELSCGNMYSDDKVPHKEGGPIEPWTLISKWKRQVEKEIDNLNVAYTVLRLPVVYGLGDKAGLTPRILLAAIYKHLNKPMKLLWNAEMKVNTIHVDDVCRAIEFVCNRDDTLHQIYNVVDEANSTQGSLSEILSSIFNIKVEYYGNMISSVVDLEDAADEANDLHLLPWAELCREYNIQNTPLSPHIDREVFNHKHLFLDGGKLKAMGFKVNNPKPNRDNIMAIIEDYIKMNVFPNSLAI